MRRAWVLSRARVGEVKKGVKLFLRFCIWFPDLSVFVPGARTAFMQCL